MKFQNIFEVTVFTIQVRNLATALRKDGRSVAGEKRSADYTKLQLNRDNKVTKPFCTSPK